jgi:hypothetical protein
VRYPWVNVTLLFLLVFQLLTGFLGLITGTEALRWIIQLHDLSGYAIAVLLLWKGVIIFDVLNRVRRLNVARSAFLLLTVLLLLILATGLVWPWVGYTSLYGFSLMTIHALLTLALGGLLLWHTLARRFVLRLRYVRGRRAFLRFAGIAVAGVFFSQLAEVANAALHFPGSARRFTGSYQAGAPGEFPVVSWLLDFPAPVDAGQWRLVVDGQVERPASFSYDQVKELALDSLEETIDCTGGWYSMQEWRGVNLSRILDLVGVKENAQSVTIESVSGYGRRYALAETSALLLAIQVAGQVLDHGHGFPVRLVAPGHRGFDWVKWVTRLHVNDTNELLQPPVPLQ